MDLPTKLLPLQLWVSPDGGSLRLAAADAEGSEHEVILAQRTWPQATGPRELRPGRLYFDGSLVETRSAEELGLLEILKGARDVLLGESPSRESECIAEAIGEILDFVGSERSIRFAQLVDTAEDRNKFDVRVQLRQGDELRQMVALARLLNVPASEVHQLVREGAPIARDISALELAELSGKLEAAGLGWKVDSSFSEKT
jgi:hypothetical protein